MNLNLKQMLSGIIIFSALFTNFAHACNKSCPHMKELHRQNHEHCGKGNFREKISNRLSSKLDLTTEQKNKVDSILEDNHKKTKAIFDETRPKMEAIRKSTDEEIKAVLTPEQKVKFEKLREKREEKIKKWHSMME